MLEATETLPGVRQLNNFSNDGIEPFAEESVGMSVGGVEEAPMPGDVQELTHEEFGRKYAAEIAEGDRVIVEYLEEQLVVADGKFQRMNFGGRMLRNRMRATNKTAATSDQWGRVVYGSDMWNGNGASGSGFAGAGANAGGAPVRNSYPPIIFTQGWTFRAIKTGGDYMYRTLFEAGADGFMMWLNPKGTRDGKIVARCLTKLFRYLFRRADFETSARSMCYDVFGNGTSVMRLQLVSPVTMKRDESGGFSETIAPIEARFTYWPIEDVRWSSPEKPSMRDQESMWWISRGVNVHDFEDEEAVYDVNQWYADGSPAARKVKGQYFNLNMLRDWDKVGPTSNNSETGYDQTLATQSEIQSNLSAFPLFDRVDCETTLPLYFWLANKKISPRYFQYHGIDVGMLPADGDEGAIREFGRRIGKIARWKVSYIRSNSAPSVNSGKPMMIAFSEWEYDRAPNSAFDFMGFRDETRSLGQSVADVGYLLEDAADIVLNALEWTQYFNAYPSVVSDAAIFQTRFGDEIQRLFTPLTKLDKRPGTRAADAIEIMQLPAGSNSLEIIAFLQNQFETTIGITQAAQSGQGAGSTNTLGQLNQEIQATDNRLDGVKSGIVKELDRMCVQMLDMLEDALGRDGLLALLKKVSGDDGHGLEDDFMTIEARISDEFEVGHPSSFGRNRDVMGAQMLNIFKVVAPAYPDVYDPWGFTKTVNELTGNMNTDQFMNEDPANVDTADEFESLKIGDYVKPNRMLDPIQIITNLMDYEAELQKVANGEYDGVMPPEQEQVYYEHLVKHARELTVMLQIKMNMAQGLPGVAGQLMQPPPQIDPTTGAPVTPPPGGEDGAPQATPQSAGGAQAVAQGVQNQANQGKAVAA